MPAKKNGFEKINGGEKTATSLRLESGWGEDESQSSSPQVGFSWLHVPPAEGISVVVLSESPSRYTGHWAGSFIVPCRKAIYADDCAHCRLDLGTQQRFVLTVYVPLLNQTMLQEFGETTAKQIKALLDRAKAEGRERTLRGLPLMYRREGGRPRGRILVAEHKADYALTELPEAMDPTAALEATWSRQKQHQRALPFGGPASQGTLPSRPTRPGF